MNGTLTVISGGSMHFANGDYYCESRNRVTFSSDLSFSLSLPIMAYTILYIIQQLKTEKKVYYYYHQCGCNAQKTKDPED